MMTIFAAKIVESLYSMTGQVLDWLGWDDRYDESGARSAQGHGRRAPSVRRRGVRVERLLVAVTSRD